MKRILLSLTMLLAVYGLSACQKSAQAPEKHVVSVPLDQAMLGTWHTKCDTTNHQEEQWDFADAGNHTENILTFDEKDAQCATATATSIKAADSHYSYVVQGQGSKARGIVTITTKTKTGDVTNVDYNAAVVKGDSGPELYLRAKGGTEPVKIFVR